MRFRRRMVVLLSLAGGVVLAGSCSKGSTTPSQILTLTKATGDSQVAAAGAALGAALTVHVKDQNGTAVSGAVVSWGAGAGGGTVGGPTSSTDASGNASITRTLGPAAGYQGTTASISGATGSPITFTSIAQINGAFQIAAVPGAGLSDTVLATLSSPFQFLVTDYTGAPVSGDIVSFAVTAGGGNLSQGSDTSDVAGHVATTLTFPSTVGQKTVQATVTGLIGSPVSVFATATSGHAASMTKGTGDAQSAFRTTALPNPHTVVIHDAHGNPVGGFAIHWVPGTGGGTVSDSTPVSVSDGSVAVVYTLGDSAGTQTDTARAALTGSPIVFSSTATVPPLTGAVTVGPNISFSPTSVTIAVGGSVTWTWASGSLSHSVQFQTASAGDSLPSSSGVQSSGTFKVTFHQAGTFTYDCSIHGSAMTGTIIVL